jgi:hypothetical protein
MLGRGLRGRGAILRGLRHRAGDVAAQEEVETDAQGRVPGRGERRTAGVVAHEVPGDVARPPERERERPASDPGDRRGRVERGPDGFNGDVRGRRPTAKAEEQIGAGGEDQPDAVHQELPPPPEPPGTQDESGRGDDAEHNGDFRVGESCDQGWLLSIMHNDRAVAARGRV